MSQFLLIQKYFQNIKIRVFIDQVNETLFQGWSHMHNLLFWMVSVTSNHWKLKGNDTMVMDNNFLFGHDDGLSPNVISPPLSLHSINREQAVNRTLPLSTSIHFSEQAKPKSFLRKKHPFTMETTHKVVTKKQSLTTMKNQVLSWKQKLGHKHSNEDLNLSPMTTMTILTPKKSHFLRRRASSSGEHESHPFEPPSPTTSLFKSISFKLKRQQDIVSDSPFIENSIRRLSLSTFKRKNSSDSTFIK